MKKIFALSMVLLMVLSMGVFAAGQQEAAADDGGMVIAYVGYSTTTPFWITLRDAAKAKAKDMGVTFLDLTPPEPNASEQKNSVDNAILQNVDGIIIGSVDNRAFDDSLNKAAEAGIPVVAVDTGIDHDQVKSLVQTDNLKSARIAGQYIVDNTEKGKVLILGGTLGHQTGNARRDGVLEVCEDAGYEVIFRACDWDDAKAYETASNELSANDDIVAIFSAWDPGALAAKAVVKERGLLDDILICGFDGNPANLKAINAGEVEATVKQDNVKMAEESIMNMVKIINGEDVPAFIPIDGFIIDKDNVSKYLK